MRVGPNRQRGMTGLGWLTVLFIIGFFSFLAIKLIPIYLEHYSIKTVVYSLENEPLLSQQSPAEIRKLIDKRLTINGVYEMDKDAIKIKKVPGLLSVEISYEVRKPMAGNVDVLVSFSDKVELVSH